MINRIHASRRLFAVLSFVLSGAAAAAAFELAGTVPESYFSADSPSIAIETINDSTGACVDRVETDDRRSFGLRAYASWRDFAFALACDGFTFRGSAAVPGSRSDELSIAAAWMGRPLVAHPFSARLGAGAGLRAWDDFGFMAIQRLWHDVLGVGRPFPTAFNESTIRPFAYASADAAARIAGTFRAEASIRELALGSGALESSIALVAAQRGGQTANWAGLSWQGRLGSFDLNDSLANEYEEGLWLVAGARTGILSIVNSLNLRTNFAIESIGLRFGGPRGDGGEGGSAPRQELSVATSFLQSELSTSRFVALPLRGGAELHLGIETIEGVSRWLWNELALPHFQEASAAAEIYAPGSGDVMALRPFAGVAIGARQEALSVSALERSELVFRVSGFLCKVYAGLRVLDFPLSSDGREMMSVDLAGGISFMTGSFHPPEATLAARIAVRDR